jgi:hypothetical protein
MPWSAAGPRAADQARTPDEIEVFLLKRLDVQAGVLRRIIGKREIDRPEKTPLGITGE